jgi:predicted O-methyltransferase YrrM
LTAEPRADGWHALRMSPDAWTAVDDYLTESLVGVDPILDAAQHASSAAGLPPISVTAVQGKFLALLCHIAGARHVLEIGTLGGYSTIWLARGLPADGIVVSLEVSQQHAEVARANIDRAALPQQVEVIVGPALETLPGLASHPGAPFDLVFIDADKANMPGYLEAALELARPGTVIVGDNVVRDGRVLDSDGSDEEVNGVRRFLDLLRDDPRLDATALQTVGSKGWDGFALAVVS